MIQWFRGELEASYVGTPNAQPFFSARPAAAHYKLSVYRAALKNVERIEAPHVAGHAPLEPAPSFGQARVDDALIANVRGAGTSYQGPIFELQVSEPHFSHAVLKDGRAYGRLTGRAVLSCELPPEPERPAVDTTIVAAPADAPSEFCSRADPRASTPLAAELRVVAPSEQGASGERTSSAPPAPSASAQADAATQAEQIPKRAPLRRSDSAAPLFALSALVALGLWASCGAQPALLWCVFLAPTLLARKLFHGVLDDSSYIRGFGALLAIGQLLCVSTLISEWWSVPCKELHVLPLIGIVVVIFPAGVLPSVVPLLFNAAGLALVLAVWCGGQGSACLKVSKRPGVFAPATVEHPGVPRTNDDGTWPRRPPGR
jgi:hypothetical protein